MTDWIARDLRGGHIGLAPASDEHPGAVDVVGQLPHGHVVLVRLDAVGVAALAEALLRWLDHCPLPRTPQSPHRAMGDATASESSTESTR